MSKETKEEGKEKKFKKLYTPRRPKPANLTQCIIEGHYYKEYQSVRLPKLQDKNSFYVRCTRCGDRRIIHDKAGDQAL